MFLRFCHARACFFEVASLLFFGCRGFCVAEARLPRARGPQGRGQVRADLRAPQRHGYVDEGSISRHPLPLVVPTALHPLRIVLPQLLNETTLVTERLPHRTPVD